MKSVANFTANIDYQKLLGLHQEYVVKKHPKLRASAGNKDDTKSIWFELNGSMKSFLNDILTDPNVSGIRVYLCAYKDNVDTTGPIPIPHKTNYLKRLTVGLVTTTPGITGGHADYPNSLAFADRSLVILPSQNHGELCPPDICP